MDHHKKFIEKYRKGEIVFASVFVQKLYSELS